MDSKARTIGLNSLLAAHFAPLELDELVVTRRDFPHWMRPDLQRALESLLAGLVDSRFCGARVRNHEFWVLRYSYGLPTAAIARSFLALLGLPTVTFEDAPAAHLAIRMLERGIDFADALHLASSAAAERFVTFDARLVKRARKVSPVPVVLA